MWCRQAWGTLCALLMLASSCLAQTIELKRGLPTDIWLSWPEAERLDEPGLIKVFPEYRQEFSGNEFAMVKRAGFDFVRLTVDPAIYLWNRRAEKTAQLNAGVAQAIADIRGAGLKVIVDMHSIPRADPSPSTEQMLKSDADFDRYLEVVRDVAGALAEQPAEEVAFEPMNEPTIDCQWDQDSAKQARWPGLLKKLHKAARESAPKLTLILSGACWGGADGLTAINPKDIGDDNVIWSFHNYEPMTFTHQGASWNDGSERYIEGLAFPPAPGSERKILRHALNRLSRDKLSAERRAELAAELRDNLATYYRDGEAGRMAMRAFDMVDHWAAKHQIPAQRIILGEFGAIRGDLSKQVPDKIRAGYYRLIRSAAEARGYAWSTWSWGGSFGLTAKEKGRAFSPVLLEALGLHGEAPPQ